MGQSGYKRKQNFHIDLMIPADDVDLTVYEDLLDLAFDTPEVCNVALTGIFGAGKSSILKTYQKERPKKEIVFISLANLKQKNNLESGSSFGEKSAEDPSDEKAQNKNDQNENPTEEKPSGTSSKDLKHSKDIEHKKKSSETVEQKLLEDRIYQQLKYYLHPLGRYGWREPGFIWKCFQRFFSGFITCILILCVGFIWKFQCWQQFCQNMKEQPKFLQITTTNGFFFAVAAVGICAFICTWFLFFGKIKSFTLEIKGGTVVWEDGETSLGLRERTDEIVHLIRRLKADAVVFEDLDRYPDLMTSVIESLIDINFILNMNSLRPMERWFQYHVRKYKNWHKGHVMADRICKISGFILFIILFVRLFFYNVYLFGLAMVLFGLLIFYLVRLKNKWKYHVLFIYACNNGIICDEDNAKYFNMQIPVIPVLSVRNVEELLSKHLNGKIPAEDSAAVIKIISKYIDNYNQIKHILMNFYIYNGKIGENGDEDTWLDKMKVFVIAVYETLFPEDFSQMQKGKGYLDYIFKIYYPQIRSTGSNDLYQHKPFSQYLQDICKKADSMDSASYLKGNATLEFAAFTENSKFPVVAELLEGGYINEMYEDYITYFYNRRDDIRERRFIDSLWNNGKPYDYILLHPENIYSEIPDNAFEKSTILNYSLMEYILKEDLCLEETGAKNDCRKKMEKIFEQLRINKNFQFIIGFLFINRKPQDTDIEQENTDISKNFLSRFLAYCMTRQDDIVCALPALILRSKCGKEEQEELLFYVLTTVKVFQDVLLDQDENPEENWNIFCQNLNNALLSNEHSSYFMQLAETKDMGILASFRLINLKFESLYCNDSFCRVIFKEKLFAFSEKTFSDFFRNKNMKKAVPWECLTTTIYENHMHDDVIMQEYISANPKEYMAFVIEFYKSQQKILEDEPEGSRWLEGKMFADELILDETELKTRRNMLEAYRKLGQV